VVWLGGLRQQQGKAAVGNSALKGQCAEAAVEHTPMQATGLLMLLGCVCDVLAVLL
jgi:hypothetical protein